ncbi:MAG: hypothetical protein IKB86_07575 [Clostridia bacterium]|nr:hypothetical protein [Clostridia bacterium]
MDILLSCLPSVITGVFLFVFQHRIQKQEKTAEDRDNMRNQYIKLIVDLTLATHALSEANTQTLKGRKNNEDVNRALDYAREIKHKHRDFLETNGINNIF